MLLAPLILLASCAPVQNGDADLHPSDATFYVAVPDLRELIDAYGGAAAAQLIRDAQVTNFAAKISGRDPEDYSLSGELLERAVEGISSLPPQVGEALGLLGDARAFSMSVNAPEMSDLIAQLRSATSEEQAFELVKQKVGVLCFMEFQSPEAATGAAEMLASIPGTLEMEDGEVPALQLRGASGTPVRLQVEGAPLEYWVVAAGNKLALGLGNATPGSLAARAEDPSRSLAARAEFQETHAGFLAAEGVTVYETWFHVDSMSDLIHMSTSGVPDTWRGEIDSVVSDLVGSGPLNTHTRSRLNGDRFVTETVATEDELAGGMLSFLGTEPIDAETIAYLPSDAVGAWVTRMDPDRLLEHAMELVTRLTGNEPGETLMMLERDYGLRPAEDLFNSLGTRGAVYMLPISGLTIPKVHAIVELRDPAAFQRGLEALGRMAEDVGGGEVQVQTRPYRDVPLFTFSPKRNIGELAGDAGAPAAVASMVPNLLDPEFSIAVIGDRALIGISARSNKREIKRILGEEGEDVPMHPLGAEGSGVPGDAISAGYMDWGAIVGGFYSSFRTLMPMIAQAAQELPFGPEDLPKADIFEQYFGPSISWSRRSEAGIYEYSESSFGPEIPLAGLAAGLGAALIPRMVSQRSASVTMTPQEPETPERDEAAELERARDISVASLHQVKVAVVLFKTEHQRYPETLAELLEPSSNFPEGLVDGQVLPDDGWGRAIHYALDPEAGTYTLWSVGADGVDDGGTGDDVLLN